MNFKVIIEDLVLILVMVGGSIIYDADKNKNSKEKRGLLYFVAKAYVKIIVVWGMYSGLTAYDGRFGEVPQKIAVFMVLAFLGVGIVEYFDKNQVIGKWLGKKFK